MMTRQGTNLCIYHNSKKHFIDFFLYLFIYWASHVWFYRRSLGFPFSSSWPFKQCRARAPSHCMGLQLNQTLVGHPHKFCATLAQAHLSGLCGWVGV